MRLKFGLILLSILISHCVSGQEQDFSNTPKDSKNNEQQVRDDVLEIFLESVQKLDHLQRQQVLVALNFFLQKHCGENEDRV